MRCKLMSQAIYAGVASRQREAQQLLRGDAELCHEGSESSGVTWRVVVVRRLGPGYLIDKKP